VAQAEGGCVNKGGGMDSNIVIAVAGIGGTLLAAVVSAIITYRFQKRASERQREWALEDEERRKEHERKTAQRNIKRELLCKRLDMIEESAKIMMQYVGRTIDKDMGVPYVDDKDALQKKIERLQSIRDEAWAALNAINSKKLTKHWESIDSAYWEAFESDAIAPKSWDRAYKAYPEIIKLTDEMRATI
jgi:hypothetical protein